MTARYELIPVTITATFTCGVLLALAPGIRAPLAKRLGIAAGPSLFLPLVFRLALVPGLLVAGLMIDYWGVQWVLVLGSLLGALAVAGLALGQRYPLALAAAALVAAAAAATGAAGFVLMPAAFFPEKPVVALNLGGIFLVLGLLAGPMLCAVLLERLAFRRTMGLLALFCLVPALTSALTVAEAFPSAARPLAPALPLDDAVFWTLGLGFLLYGPLEQLLATRTAPYLSGFGCSARRTGWLVSGFWLAFLGSRLLAAMLFQPGPLRSGTEAWSLFGVIVAATVLLGNLAGTTARSFATSGILMLGFCLGPVLPTLLGLAFEHFPNEPGGVCGALFALAALSSVTQLPLTEDSARRVEAERTLRGPLVLALLLGAVSLALGLVFASR